MDPSVFLKAQSRFVRTCRIRLLLLSVALVALWFLSRTVAFSPEENALWERVRNAEEALSAARYGKSGDDPERLGVIGVEWSPISTTLGSLPSKRTAADPFWSVVLFREMARMGLRAGTPRDTPPAPPRLQGRRHACIHVRASLPRRLPLP